MSATEATARVAVEADTAPGGCDAARPAPRLAGKAPFSISRVAIALQSGAALFWLPQAALLSLAIGNIAAGAPARAAFLPALSIFLLGILRAAMERAGMRLALAAARGQLSALRADAAFALASHSPADARRPSSGHVASVLAEQADAIVPWLARHAPLRAKAALVPAVIFACVFTLSWAAALVLLVAAPLIPVFMALIGWQAKEASARQLSRLGDMNGFLLDRLRGLATIRALKAVDRTALRLRADAEGLRAATMKVLRIAFLSSAVLELFAMLGVAMVAVYVGFHYLGALNFGAWGAKLTLGQGLFILLLAPAFFEPLRELSAVWHDRAAGEAGLEAVDALMTPAPAIVGALESQAQQHDGAPLSVALDGVCFGHAGQDAWVFAGLNLSIHPGEHVALMAPSGGGKSTLLALIAGLAPASAGTIRLGGAPLTATTAASLRQRMAWLGQPPHIFTTTLKGNITLDRPQVGPAELRRAVATARLDTLAAWRGPIVIGENGAGLSGGEAVRLALARAAASQGTGLFLADEPTAHLDSATAAEVSARLLAIAAGSTLIVATHDPELALRMDRIITLPSLVSDEVPA